MMSECSSSNGLLFQGEENVLESDSGDGCKTLLMSVLKTTKFYTLKKWILLYVNYNSI